MINFLDMEKINRGQVFYDHEQVIILSKAVNLKVILFKEIAARENITIKSDVEEFITIKIDPYAIDRIINNLIDNAIRYTNRGGQINVLLKRTNAGIQFIVKDTGIGISKEKQQVLFEPFYQLSHEKRNIQGIGIGLSIVKKIMNQVKGKIDVISEEGIGTTFILSFNAPDHDAQTSVIHNDHYSQPIDTFFSAQLLAEYYNPEKDTVLIVEDNINMLAYIQLSLVNYYNVFYACNGVEALEKLQKMTRPQVIVSDIMMDEMDGYEFFGILQKDEKYCSIPFIFLTVKNTLQEKLEGLGRGAIDFIYKPFSLNELLAKIKTVIKNQQSIREFELSEMEIKLSRFLRMNFQRKGLSRLEELCDTYSITQREKDIILLLTKGLEYKEISYQLNISINTLKPYIRKIYKKLQVQNKVELTNLINLQ
jgi:DNA-binding NarL/FixJ family response regulator/anti-sigma regulatory factor (Ser/Thr protein kinase)